MISSTRLANLLHADQVKVAGVLQENARDVAGFCSAMTLVDLTSRSRFRISQDLGSQAQGCRLDARGIAEIGPMLERTLDQNVELNILNLVWQSGSRGRRPPLGLCARHGIRHSDGDSGKGALCRCMVGIPRAACRRSRGGSRRCPRLVPRIGAAAESDAAQRIVANRLNAGPPPWVKAKSPRSAS